MYQVPETDKLETGYLLSNVLVRHLLWRLFDPSRDDSDSITTLLRVSRDTPKAPPGAIIQPILVDISYMATKYIIDTRKHI